MEEISPCVNVPNAARVRLVILATALGLMLTLTTLIAQARRYGQFYGADRGAAEASGTIVGAPVTDTDEGGALRFADTDRKVGPLFAEANERISYTIFVENVGGLVEGMVLSDALPGGVVFIPRSCTYVTQTGPMNACGPLTQLWQLDLQSGDRVTTTYDVTVTAGTMRWPLRNRAYLAWHDSQKALCFTTIVNPWHTYLPLVVRSYPESGPDLYVTSLTVEPISPTVDQPVTVTLVVKNIGEVAAGPFWVDFYDNPTPPPTEANQTWDELCTYGIAWYVGSELASGESVTLTSLEGYVESYTNWPGSFADSGGHDLYAFADSSGGASYGAVLEKGEGLHNRYGPVTITVSSP